MSDDWDTFIVKLEHWGLAARGLHGPRGLGRPNGAEPLPEWKYPDDDEIERLVGLLRLRDQGQSRIEAIVRYYVHGAGDVAAAIKMRVTRSDFERFRMETERFLFDDYQREKKPQ